MIEDSLELNGLDIKPYISSQMNCRVAASGYVLDAVNSHLNLDLSSIPGIIKATIIFSRISGNGKVKINNINTDVLSTTSHQIDLDILENKKINFSRDQNSIGKIIINKIIIINVENLIAKLAKNEFEVTESINKLKKYNENWKSNFIKLGNVRGIKLINDKIYAQEGAQVLHANIIEFIETEPPKCFTISDVIKFIYPCEIKSVYFKQEFENLNVENKFHHFAKPPQIKSDISYTENYQNEISNMDLNNIYDSYSSKLNPDLLLNSKDIIGNQGKNNSGLLLKREAEFQIPISGLKPHTQYNIIACLKKINGNGKFGAAIITINGEIRSAAVIIAPDRETEVYIKLNTDSPPIDEGSYILKIFRPEDSTTGDVLLERLVVNQGLNVYGSFITKTVKGQQNKFVYENKKYTIESVLKNSKKYARKNNSWIDKVKSIYPNYNFSNISFSSLDSLIKNEKMWIEPFEGDEISENDNLILSRAKVLISSCPNNFNLFKEKYSNIDSYLLEKVWPQINPIKLNYPNGDYAVMLNRDNDITDKVIDLYDWKNYPPLVIIGATKNYPNFVIPMNEYISYEKMLGIILNSKLIIDISKNLSYFSGFLSICFNNGIPILTSNDCYLNDENVTYLKCIDEINDKLNISLTKNKIDKLNTNNNIDLQEVIQILLK